jgi:uncharacterized protein (DUF2236 family)
MQLAHPLIAAGVTRYSSFQGEASQAAARAHQTVGAMLALTFGDDDRRTAAIEHIRGIHRMVNGTLAEDVGSFPAGTHYSAEDPALLLWVHATLLDSVVDVYQRVVAALQTAELDAFCLESLPTLFDLGGNPATAPRTWAALQDYVRGVERSGVLAVTPATRAFADLVLWPRGVWPVAVGPVNRAITIGLLPPAVRDVYGYAWDAARARRFERAMRVVRATRQLTPRVLAQWRDARSVR